MPKPVALHSITATYVKENGDSSFRRLLSSEIPVPKTTISALDLSDLTPQQCLQVQDSYAKYQIALKEHLQAFPSFAAWSQAHAPETPSAPIKTFKVSGLQDVQTAQV